MPKSFGYLGFEIGEILKESNIYPEFYDKDALVLMFTPENKKSDFENLISALKNIKKRAYLPFFYMKYNNIFLFE